VDCAPITLQSVSKLVILIGLLEEFGPKKVFNWVKVEPSGTDFASIARLDQFGPAPSNPLLNSGAIALCSRIPGNHEEQLSWLDVWVTKLFGEKLTITTTVYASERRTGDRNRSIAYLMKSTGVIENDIEMILDTYFCLCSYEANITQAAYLPMLLAAGGQLPGSERVFSRETANHVIAIMATCGLYNESGTHLVRTGMPAKSGVSGFTVAVSLKKAGIAALSPRVNKRGNSIRGEIMLEEIAKELNWHFAQ